MKQWKIDTMPIFLIFCYVGLAQKGDIPTFNPHSEPENFSIIISILVTLKHMEEATGLVPLSQASEANI